MKLLTTLYENWDKFFAALLLVVAVVYDINPIDFVPDIAPFIGWLDDIVVSLIAIINAYINWRKGI